MPYYRYSTFAEYVASLYFQLTIVISMTVSSAIAVCRFINIKYPFYKIKKLAVVIGCIISATTYMIPVTLLFYQIGKVEPYASWNRYSTQTYYLELNHGVSGQPSHVFVLFILLKVTRIVIVGFGVVISMMSVLQLSWTATTAESSRENIKKSSIVIAAMNIFNMMIVIANSVSHLEKYGFSLPTFLGGAALYFIGAGFNPLIRILASKDILKYCKSLLTLGNSLSSPATSSSTAKSTFSNV